MHQNMAENLTGLRYLNFATQQTGWYFSKYQKKVYDEVRKILYLQSANNKPIRQ